MFKRVSEPNKFNPSQRDWPTFIKNLKDYLHEIATQINTQIQDVGPDLAAATQIAPSHAIHVVTGINEIDTIVPPVGFSGFIRLVAAQPWTIGVAGNVSRSVSPAVGETVLLDYIPKLGKWFPLGGVGIGGGGAGPIGPIGPRGPAGPPGFIFAGSTVEGDVPRTPKRLHGPALVGAAAATKYTVPALVKTIIQHIHVSNSSGGAVPFTMSIGADAAGTRIFDQFPIAANSVLDHFCDYAMEATEIMQAFAGTASLLTLTIDGEECTLG